MSRAYHIFGILALLCLMGVSNKVMAQPIANFTANPTYGCGVPHTVFFTDFSTLPDTWSWDFGDGNTSTLQNPVHSYTTTGTFTVTLIVTDTITGNTDQTTGTIVVGDTASPTITCPGNQTGFFDASCQLTMPDYTGLAVVTDDCDAAPVVTQSPAVGSSITSATTTVTLTATDASSNSSSCTFTLTLSDTISPTIACPIDQNVFYDANCEFTLADYTSMATTGDNCSINQTVTQSPAAGLNFTSTTTVTLFVDDNNGNMSSCTFQVIPSDTISPSITCPGNQTASYDANCQFTLIDYTNLAAATDNCGSVTVSQSPAVGTVISSQTTITLTATDGSGNTKSCTFDVVPADVTGPVISCITGDTVYTTKPCNSTVPNFISDVSATDNCDINPVFSQSPTAGTLLTSTGTQIITVTYTDASGNSTDCQFTLYILDTIPPTISCNSDIQSCDPVVNFSPPTAVDGCGPATVTLVSALGPGATFPIGTTTVTYIAEDQSGNTDTCEFEVEVLERPTATAVATDVTCFGDNDGEIDVTTTGGTPSYTYAWNHGPISEDLTGLAAGTYTVIVSDSNNCTDTATATVNEPPEIVVSGNATDVSCYGEADGTIDITVSGGAGGFTYMWSNGSSSEDQVGLAGASYTVAITDANNCTVTEDFTITEPDSIVISCNVSTYSHGFNVSENGASDGSVDISVSGGTPGYTYNWSTGDGTQDISDVPAGTYTIIVTDSRGCTEEKEVVVTEPPPVTPATAFSPNGDGLNDFYEVKNIEEYQDNTLTVMNRWGSIVYKASPYNNDWDGKANKGLTIGSPVPSGVYYFTLKIEKGSKPMKGSIVINR